MNRAYCHYAIWYTLKGMSSVRQHRIVGTSRILALLRLAIAALPISVVPALDLDLDLAGAWELHPIPAGSWEEAAPPETGWQQASIPAPRWRSDPSAGLQDGDGVWLRRRFPLTDAQAARAAALEWETVRWGFSAWINGVALPEVDGWAPGSAELPPGSLRSGDNRIVLKVRGWRRVPRGSNGEAMFPIGSARFSWGNRDAFVDGPIGLDLHGGERIRAALVDADPVAGTVRVTLRGAFSPDTSASVRVTDAAGRLLGEAQGPAVSPLTASCRALPAWNPDSPALCSAEVVLRSADGSELDRRSESFGARQVRVDGALQLDGRPLPLLGSNLVHEWLQLEETDLRSFLVDDARAMQVRGFRTHTMPPPASVAGLCDRTGQWLLAEMPATYNGMPTGLDQDEERRWRASAMAMTLAWCERLHNHPSILAWVPVNEPPLDAPHGLTAWIHDELIPAVRRHSPGRPVISAWGSTDDADDLHIYAGFWGGHEGQFREIVERQIAGRVPGRLLANTEYIEGLTTDRVYRWTGTRDWGEQTQLRYAAIGAEQTEDMRRLGYTLILPYWFGNWNRGGERWRPDAPTPMFAALRSALAQLTVAWEPVERNQPAGADLAAVAVLVNDGAIAREVHLAVHLQTTDPGWSPDGLTAAPVAERTALVRPGERVRIPVQVRLPVDERELILIARAGPAMSQRRVRTLTATPAPSARVCVLGAPAAAIAALRRLGVDAHAGVNPARATIEADVLVVWEDAVIDAATQAATAQINAWMKAGGRMLMMRQRVWNDENPWTAFPRLPDGGFLTFTVEADAASTVWRTREDPLWRDLAPCHLDGWNGLSGALVRDALVAPWLPGHAPVLQNANGWIPSGGTAVVIEGESLVCDWPGDHADARFTVDGRPRGFTHVRGTAALLCTRRAPPAGGYAARVRFTAPAMAARLQAFEHGRMGSSPFRWRIDGGTWRETGRDAKCNRLVRVSSQANVWFGWSELGEVDIAAGEHELEIMVDQPDRDGGYLLAIDALLLTSRLAATVLAQTGGGRPAIVDVPVGSGRLTCTQLLFAERLDDRSPAHDRAAVRLFLNLLGR
jgi:hypothetical protein